LWLGYYQYVGGVKDGWEQLATPSLIVAWPRLFEPRPWRLPTFALYPHKGLADYKLITQDFPWLNGLYLVDIITVVPPCVLSKALEIQFPLRANKAD